MLFWQVKYIFSGLLLIIPVYKTSGQQFKSYKYLFDKSEATTEIVSTKKEILIYYQNNEINLISASAPEGSFYRISMPGHIPSSETGKPEMPVYSKLIYLPDENFSVKITDIKTKIIHPSRKSFKGMVFPKQMESTKNQDKQRDDFVIDREIYSIRGYIKTDTVKIEYLGKIRNKSLATLHIYPVRYNPHDNELEVITSMKISIKFNSGESPLTSKGTESLPFVQSLSKGVVNYTQEDIITGYSDQPVKMIILTDTIFKKHLAPFIKWKTQKGFRVTTLYRGTSLAGNTFIELKDTLQKIYTKTSSEGSPPEYLLIIGDVNRIPLSEGTNNYSDLYYSTFDGAADYLPEMFSGRISVADTTELNNVINKLIRYEKFNFADTNTFYRRSLATAGDDDDHDEYMNGQIKYLSKYYLNPENNNIINHAYYYPESSDVRDSIIMLFNGGLGFINYSGHGDATGWIKKSGLPIFKSDDVVKLTNKNMYPFIISNACRTGQFNISGSFGNTLLKSNEKGAVGFIGCSNDSYWSEDFYWSVGVGAISDDPIYSENGLGAYDRMFHKFNEKASEWYITMGQINYAGNLSVSASTSKWKKYYWETYNLTGDPSIIPFIGTPGTFTNPLPDTLPNGISSISLNLEPYAYIAISRRDTLLDASFVSPSGTVTVDIPPMNNDSCLVVISGQNKIPFIKTIYFGDINKEFINLTKTEINDIKGNNNCKVDYDETFHLKLILSNLGLSDATQLYAKISLSAPCPLTIINDSVFIGTLNARSDTVLSDQLTLKTDELITDKSFVSLNLKLKDALTEKNYIIDIKLHAPVIELLSCLIDDSDTGNGNYFADPGETLNLVVNIFNSGSSAAEGNLKVRNSPIGVVIHNDSIATGILTPQEIKTVYIPATVSPSMKKGDMFEISLLSDCSPYTDLKNFNIPIGNTIESFEYQNFRMFPWKNTSNSPWVITSGAAWDGIFSARSGAIPNYGESKLILKVNIPHTDSIRFMYRVSSETNWDFLKFKLNGKQVFSASGEVEWKESKVEIKEGFNELEWSYVKDHSGSSGYDCAWLDYLIFPPDAFNRIDMKAGKIISPDTTRLIGNEIIIAEFINLGTDTLKQYNLAYTINDSVTFIQTFNEPIAPADTVALSFSSRYDFTAGGTYILKVYSTDNNDYYPLNDTATFIIIKTAVEIIIKPESELKIMPNPFNERFRINISTDYPESVTITLLNINGSKVWESKAELYSGENNLEISPDGIAPGIYTVLIRGKSFMKTVMVVKSY
ncbi:MAG: T9SS type A sorting domain-containing protein [Bacteroidales bacterium]|nr:T9SS type A sorting domain-containing protein [Bacteroidales bacterium]